MFWEFGEESSFWSTEGCQLAEMTDDKVSCDCDHATNFAILVVCSSLQDPGTLYIHLLYLRARFEHINFILLKLLQVFILRVVGLYMLRLQVHAEVLRSYVLVKGSRRYMLRCHQGKC